MTLTPTPTLVFLPAYTPGQVEAISYDFSNNLCLAQWRNGAGALPCPSQENDNRGFAVKVNQPGLDGNVIALGSGILMSPQNIKDGSISGVYPAIQVRNGDHFRVIIACEAGRTKCLVIFRLDYQIGSDPPRIYWAFGEQSDDRYWPVDLDLSLLAGQKVKFTLSVFSVGAASTDNRAIWFAPRIVHTLP